MSQHGNRGKVRLMIGLLVVGLVTSACSSAVAKSDLGAGCDQFGSQKNVTQQADLAVGDQIKVVLCSNPTTGFSWQEPEFSNPGVVILVDRSFAAATSDGTAPLVGAAGAESITLKAAARGTTTMVVEYSQPWAGGTSGAWAYTLTIAVK